MLLDELFDEDEVLRDRYVITYDFPLYETDSPDSVKTALNKIGVVKEIPCAPATTIGFTANFGVTDGTVRGAVRKALNPNEPTRKTVVVRLSGEAQAWAWPTKDTKEARATNKWLRVF